MKQLVPEAFRPNRLFSGIIHRRGSLMSRSAGAVSKHRRQYLRRLLVDLIVIPLCFFLALQIRFEGYLPYERWVGMGVYVFPITVVFMSISWVFGIYRRKWAYADFEASWLIVETVGLATLLLWVLNVGLRLLTPIAHMAEVEVLPNSIIIITGLLTLFVSTGLKYRSQLWLWFSSQWAGGKEKQRERALVVGTNATAQQLVSQLARVQNGVPLEIIGFADDDPTIQGMNINGLPIIGTTDKIREIVQDHYIDVIIVASSTTTRQGVASILKECQDISVQIKVLPNIDELMDCYYQHPLTLQECNVADILGRQPTAINYEQCRQIVREKVILVTGAAGSIGSELCRQLCELKPGKLLALDNNETGLFELNLELSARFQTPIISIIADVTDRSKLNRLFRQYTPHVVIHAAAYKHVPIAEVHPDEAIRVNILGTVNVCNAAHEFGVERFVFISTDKAVDPVGVMGASKRLGELWVCALAKQSNTIFTSVRFGNVIGSRGSVLPIFTRQIQHGGPVTITHPAMKRYFMSIPDAASLVLQAAALSSGGEIFMLDMGPEILIQDLAERMIRLRGLRVQRDIPIRYVGIRPGEKLNEQLSYQHEERIETKHPQIFALRADYALLDRRLLEQTIRNLASSLDQPQLDLNLSARVVSAAHADYSARSSRVPHRQPETRGEGQPLLKTIN